VYQFYNVKYVDTVYMKIIRTISLITVITAITIPSILFTLSALTRGKSNEIATVFAVIAFLILILHQWFFEILFSSFKFIVDGLEWLIATLVWLFTTLFRLNLNFQEPFDTNVNVEYHDSIEDILKQQEITDIELIKNNKGDIIDIKGPIPRTPILFYNQDKYKYDNTVFVPTYADSVMLSTHTKKILDKENMGIYSQYHEKNAPSIKELLDSRMKEREMTEN